MVKQAVDEVNKLFELSTCRKPLQYKHRSERPCLNHHIGQCCAPCTGNVSPEDYAERVEQAVTYLTQGGTKLVSLLTERMNAAAESLDFEAAARLRDRIRAIERMGEKQKVVRSRIPHQDIIALARSQEVACFEVFRFAGGALTDREHFFVELVQGETAARAEFLRRYYSQRDEVPPCIFLDGETEDRDLLEQWLTDKASSGGRKYHVKLLRPQRGEQARLVAMCQENAAERVAQRLETGGREVAALAELQQLLGITHQPLRIESYDISHTAGSDPVAGMVVFQGGRPCRTDYRRFEIKESTPGDDPACLREVLTRRLREYEQHKETDEGFGRLPDLILLDGGDAQVAAVRPLLEPYAVPVFGMVKDSHHRTRAITADGRELSIVSRRAAFTLISSIQEEVHRYAIGYHRQKRRRRSVGTSLTAIPGVGEKRAAALLRHFGSVTAVRNATIEQLVAVKGITEPAARAIHRFFADSVDRN